MRLNITGIRMMMILLLILFPMITWAGEESGKTAESKPAVEEKPAAESKESEPQQEKYMITGEVAASVLSAYIWRGQEMTRHGVVVQPSATIGYRGFSFNVWGNIDTRPYSAGEDKYSPHLSETDVTLSYTHKFGIVSLGAGYIYYGLAALYPGGADPLDAQEIFVTMSVDTLLTPTLTVYKEIDHYHQWYATLGISHTFALHERVGLKLAGQISYLKSEDETTYPKFDSDSLATMDKFNNFHDATFTISLPVSVTKNIAITPLLTYVFPLSNDARYEMKARGLQGTLNPSDKDSSSFLYGGVTLSFAF
ncbi:MAG: hypothetical protein ABFD63_13280 [Smithella sp.]|jgi:hypothetical protein